MNLDKQHNVKDIDISKEMQESFLEYAMSVIVSRAIPDVRDGLKPVHRRILYAMYDLGITYDKPYKKSARITGEIIGKYHPHGDTAVYYSMVRMAQEFSSRYPLVDGQGNFGSIDGDNPAAMRYTESRMSKLANELVSDMNKDTVDFVDNYDSTEREPKVLPASFPNLLVNGSKGIAVSITTDIPPHNLNEIIDALIYVLENPQVTIEQLISQDIVKGPDFPTGASIIGNQRIKKAYLTGRDTITVRGKVSEETFKNGRKALVINEIPYQLNKTRLIERISHLVKNKEIQGIYALRDESNHEGIRVVMELKNDVSRKILLNKLYKMTPLQSTHSINLIALNNGRPKLLNLLQILQAYLEHQFVVLVRKTKFELQKNQDRAHICEGLVIALSNIDAIVRLIKKTNAPTEAIDKLVSEFALSKIQAQAILQMRLQRLTGLEQVKLEEELQTLNDEIAQCQKVLQDVSEQTKIISKQLITIKNNYGDPRRTIITSDEEDITIDEIALIKNEPVVIIFSENGYIKRLNLDEYRTQKRGGTGVNTINLGETDDTRIIIIANTHDDILFFSDVGKVYRLKAYEISSFSRVARGTPIINLINIERKEKIKTLIAVNSENSKKYLFFITKNGIVKRTAIGEFDSIRKTGKIAIDFKTNDSLVEVLLTTGDTKIIIATSNGKAIHFNEKEIRLLQRKATGIKGIMLDNDCFVIGGCTSATGSNIITISENGLSKITPLQSFRLTKRATKGVKAMKLTSKTGDIVTIKAIKGNEEMLIVTNNGIGIRVNLSEMKISQRNSSGVKLIKLKSEQKIKTSAIISVN